MIYLWCILIICIGGGYGDSCYRSIRECGELPKDIPKNAEELESGCIALQNGVKCILNTLDDCNELDDERKEENVIVAIQLRKIAHFLEVSCNPESELFQVASQNIECAYPVLKTMETKCGFEETSEKRRKVVLDYARILMGDDESVEITYCIDAVWSVACTASLVSDKCGSDALQAMVAILTGANYKIERYCTPDIVDEIPTFAAAVASAEHQAEVVENGI